MDYSNPALYWKERYAKEGALACARRGMDEAASGRQADAFWAAIGPRIPEGSRLLDFGCGPGRLFLALDYHGLLEFEYVGVDACEEAVRLAREARARFGAHVHRPHFAHLAGDSIPFPDGYFDAVVACTVVQHLPDEGLALWMPEMRRVLRPGGRCIILDGNGCRASHAKSRTPEEIGAALGMEMDGPAEQVSAEAKASHFVASFLRGCG